jgi:hypothetical protein
VLQDLLVIGTEARRFATGYWRERFRNWVLARANLGSAMAQVLARNYSFHNATNFENPSEAATWVLDDCLRFKCQVIVSKNMAYPLQVGGVVSKFATGVFLAPTGHGWLHRNDDRQASSPTPIRFGLLLFCSFLCSRATSAVVTPSWPYQVIVRPYFDPAGSRNQILELLLLSI